MGILECSSTAPRPECHPLQRTDHRNVEFGKDLWRSPSPPFPQGRTDFKARSSCSGLILLTSDCFQWWRLYHLCWPQVQHFTTLLWDTHFLGSLFNCNTVRVKGVAVSPGDIWCFLLLILALSSLQRSPDALELLSCILVGPPKKLLRCVPPHCYW